MSKRFTRAALAVTLLATTACTQPGAEIELKGQDTYGRSGGSATSRSASSHSTYTPSASAYNPPPIYTNTQPPANYSSSTNQKAPASSIGVSDLAPPPKKGSENLVVEQPAKKELKAASAAVVQPAKVEVKQAAADTAQPVNHWTNKPHFTDTNAAASQPAPAKWTKDDKEVAHLDNIIDNSAAKPKATAAAASQPGFIWPVNGRKIISGFGSKGPGKANDGINIAAGSGEPVWAVADGEVVYVGNELQGYGNMVLIKHAGNKTTTYAHLNRAAVDKYDRVKQGDIIGYVGSTGNVKDPQLHFAVRNGTSPVDPKKYLNTKVAGL